ncbi:hypothetical protein SLS58_010927 [Diplodia intermedia]|uniref:Uncharacterized protein n=1 Tax=Diplodia intermedia TaxID=856260 RepID=A0ABR3T407_9PEZI
MNSVKDLEKLFKPDGTPLEDDGCYQKILSTYMDMIRQIEDNYRDMGRHWHETHISIRDEAPDLDPARCHGARLARDFFDRDVDAGVVRRDVAHDVEVLIEATRRHVRRGEYPAVKANLERVDRDLRELVGKLEEANEAILVAKRLDELLYAGCYDGPDWGRKFDEMEAGLFRWAEAIEPRMPRSLYHLMWFHEPESFVD